jgi:hypothetical protein
MAAKDADRMDDCLRRYFGCNDGLISLRNNLATLPAIIDAFDHLQNSPAIRKGDGIVFYYSGSALLRAGDCEQVYVTGDLFSLHGANLATKHDWGLPESMLAGMLKRLAVLKGCFVVSLIIMLHFPATHIQSSNNEQLPLNPEDGHH